MGFIVSEGQLANVTHDISSSAGYGSRVTLGKDWSPSYAELWRSQQNLRTVVDFLGRNIAMIGLHLYKRMADDGRERVRDHPLIKLIGRPNPTTTTYRFMDALVHDLGIYDNAILAKIKVQGSTDPAALVRLNPEHVRVKGSSLLGPTKYVYQGNGSAEREFDREEIIHLRGYNPNDARWGTSPIETLKGILLEEYEATQYRRQLWRRGARISGFISRPADAPEWGDVGRKRFQDSFQAAYAGDGDGAGGTPLLEEGMTWTAGGITPEQAQYFEARKLTREEVAAAFHIPQSMVGILDHATFSNIKEQHLSLYQDTLGPWLEMIAQDLMLQLLPEYGDASSLYLEFNLADKMRGSFEEQAAVLTSSIGGPYLTVNEGRARLNLPRIDGGDELLRPLNTGTAGDDAPEADPGDPPSELAAPAAQSRAKRRKSRQRRSEGLAIKAEPTDEQIAETERVVRAFFRRQRKTVLSARGQKADGWWDEKRWNAELSDDLYASGLKTTTEAAAAALVAASIKPEEYSVPQTQGMIRAMADSRAGAINSTTKDQLDEYDGLSDEEIEELEADAEDIFDKAEDVRSPSIAQTLVTTFAAFAVVEAFKQTGHEDDGTKTWATGPRARPEHARMDGESVPLGELFSNGASGPGDPVLGADGNSGCNCTIEVNIP